jgi:hypothetical protein
MNKGVCVCVSVCVQKFVNAQRTPIMQFQDYKHNNNVQNNKSTRQLSNLRTVQQLQAPLVHAA